ncbi:MAG: hypothetical protein ABFD83_10815 [Armatimonadota bacterium]
MKKSTVLIIAAVILFTCSGCFGAAPSANGGLIPPPAINIPYGGAIIAEINLSDNDILGIIKQAIPAIAATSDDMLVQAKQSNSEPAAPIALISGLQLQKFGEVINGVKGVRLIVAQYGKNIKSSDVINDFEKGLVKTGTFSKVASGLGLVPGVVGFYAEADNAGYVAFMYDSHERNLYAARVVGSLDIPKLTEWTIRALGTLKIHGGELGDLLGVPVPATQDDGASAPNQ